ncbi:hypothetical protein ACLOJK_014793 [Asimina triloba]
MDVNCYLLFNIGLLSASTVYYHDCGLIYSTDCLLDGQDKRWLTTRIRWVAITDEEEASVARLADLKSAFDFDGSPGGFGAAVPEFGRETVPMRPVVAAYSPEKMKFCQL